MNTSATTNPEGRGTVAFLLSQVGAHAAASFGTRLKPTGATPPIAGLLRLISLAPGRSQQELATQLGMLPSRLVVLVDKLEADGLVERRRNPADRRQHALHLTDAGQRRLAEIGTIARAHAEELLAPLDPAEVAQLHELLGRLAKAHRLAPGVHPGFRHLKTQPE